MKAYGKKTWLVADGYWDSHSTGNYLSHESFCVLNTSDTDAELHFTLYFEDRAPMDGFYSFCKAGRTHHVRMDKIKDKDGNSVPTDVPYAALVESNVEIVVQYSRLMTPQPELTMATTIAYPVE